MNDSQLIEQLAVTDLYRDDVALPKTMRSDVVLLDITRRMGMDTKERTQVVESPSRPTHQRQRLRLQQWLPLESISAQ